MALGGGELKVLPPAEAEYIIAHAGRIPILAFRVTCGVFAGLAFICVCLRLLVRGIKSRRLYFDDGFLVFALLCMGAATVLLYKYCYLFYCLNAVNRAPEVTLYVKDKVGMATLWNAETNSYPYLALAWTATFSVKWSFFAFFWPLIQRVSKKLTTFYWFSVGFSVVTWAFCVAQPFILCPHFGEETAAKCWPPPVHLWQALTILAAILDVFSDLMIMSIPVIILHKSQLKRSTKIGLGAFLCLSVFMVMCSIIRIAGYTWHGKTDITWTFLWQHLEASVAVSMASITIFRSVFVARGERSSYFKPRFNSPKLPAIPGASLSIKTIIGGHREPKNMESEMSLFETDYHSHIKPPEGIWVNRSWEQKSQHRAPSTESATEQMDVV